MQINRGVRLHTVEIEELVLDEANLVVMTDPDGTITRVSLGDKDITIYLSELMIEVIQDEIEETYYAGV